MSAPAASTLPPNFRRIRLELAREPQHPEGDPNIGYSLVAPLDSDGRLDVETYADHKDVCTVFRFHHSLNKHGHLRRRPGGSWAFHYDFEDGGDDDDPAYRLGDHKFVSGEYVTIQEDEGSHTYRVARVEAL